LSLRAISVAISINYYSRLLRRKTPRNYGEIMNIHLNIKISGLVQGVFFRANAKEQADDLDIKGFAQNQPDGSVYIEAEGEKDNLEKFLHWCHTGSNMARVEKVEVSDGPLKDFKKFKVN